MGASDSIGKINSALLPPHTPKVARPFTESALLKLVAIDSAADCTAVRLLLNCRALKAAVNALVSVFGWSRA